MTRETERKHICKTNPLRLWPVVGFCIYLFSFFPVHAQQKVWKGKSVAPTGMLYYNSQYANDKTPRIYVQTVAAPNTSCYTLEFTLKSAVPVPGLVKVYAGADTVGKPLGAFGSADGPKVVTLNHPQITLKFNRAGKAGETQWELTWTSRNAKWCEQENNPECQKFRPICGPMHREVLSPSAYKGAATENENTSCIPEGKTSYYYKFTAAKDGMLGFAIVPQHKETDLDWVLWRGDPEHPGSCPDLGTSNGRLACNFAGGLGMEGSTGMAGWGNQKQVDESGNPYCTPVAAKAGEVFFLMVNATTVIRTSFDIHFNEIVTKCESKGVPDLISVHGFDPQQEIEYSRDLISQPRIVRIDLRSVPNSPLANCTFNSEFAATPLKTLNGKMVRMLNDNSPGVVAGLLGAFKGGHLLALDPGDLSKKLTWGDFADAAWRIHAGQPKVPSQKFSLSDSIRTRMAGAQWWDIPATIQGHFNKTLELLCEEAFDRNLGRTVLRVKFIRLIWAADTQDKGDFVVAVFAWEDVSSLLKKLESSNSNNEAVKVNMKEFLETGRYKGKMVVPAANGSGSVKPVEGDGAPEYKFFPWNP